MTTTHLHSQLEKIVRSGAVTLSTKKPSAWVEENVVMGAPYPGPYRYSKTPYCREIIDRLAPDDPARWVAIMKGQQIGISSGVLIPGCGYIIKEAPGKTAYTVGAPDLLDKAGEKLDLMIDRAGLRKYIRTQVQRVRASLTGDKTLKKDFAEGFIWLVNAGNHKVWRDVDLMYGLIDDFEAIKNKSKEFGDTRDLIEGRFTAYKDRKKIFYISTPGLRDGSNIEPVYLLGDQRKFLVPCPECHEFIELVWEIAEEGGEKKQGGIVFERDSHGHVIDSTVGYVCQKCAGFFKDNYKHRMLNDGYWNPTAVPSRLGFYSYHISSLYAPAGMDDWKHYAHKWAEAHPLGQPRIESKYKTFVNTCLGFTYQGESQDNQAINIIRNQRDYDPFSIPESRSITDGNGRIILLTLAADMNGKMKGFHKATEDDVRLDWEIVAWPENSDVSYSVAHGSIGTFYSGAKPEDDRAKWSYDKNHPNCVWPELDKILDRIYVTDTGRQMKIGISALDSGNYTNFAYDYQDKTNFNIYCVKGDKEQTYLRYSLDAKPVRDSLERPGRLYIVTGGFIKDDISRYMLLNWDGRGQQPSGFMNFPQSIGGLYRNENYFSHYEAEHRTTQTNTKGETEWLWKKKQSNSQNHFWDCRVYNFAARDILIQLVAKEEKRLRPPHEKNLPFTWKDFVEVVLRQTKK